MHQHPELTAGPQWRRLSVVAALLSLGVWTGGAGCQGGPEKNEPRATAEELRASAQRLPSASPASPSGAALPAKDEVTPRVRESFLHLVVKGRAARDSLGRIVSIDRVSGDEVWAYATPLQLEQLEAKGIVYERLTHPGFNPGVRMGLGSRSKGGRLAWTGYPTYPQYVQAMQDWATAYPQLARVVNLGATTNLRRPHALWAMKISKNPDLAEDEPRVFLTSTMHGDETVGYMLLLHLIEDLLTQYGTDAEVTSLVDSLEISDQPARQPRRHLLHERQHGERLHPRLRDGPGWRVLD
ncbi:MAG: M14 family zinc carboxypeptidase [Myxococcales bacterium]